MHEVKGDVLAVVPNNWEARIGKLTDRYGQFQSGKKLYREQLFKEFLESDETDFFAWARRRDFTTHELRRAPAEGQDGGVAMIEQWLPRASTGEATYLVAGDERDDVRRSTRRAPAPAPAPAPAAASDDALGEGYDPPGWDEGSRTQTTLAKILNTNPSLVSETSFKGRSRELDAIARRLKAKDASAADVLLRDKAFQWGDRQWAQWHLDNDSSDDEDEEMGEFDPFSEENVPRATKRNNKAIRDLFKRRFKIEAPTRATSQAKLFGELYGYLRACIIRNVYP